MSTLGEHDDIGIAEHGSKAHIMFGRCKCGWSSPPRMSSARCSADLRSHIENPDD